MAAFILLLDKSNGRPILWRKKSTVKKYETTVQDAHTNLTLIFALWLDGIKIGWDNNLTRQGDNEYYAALETGVWSQRLNGDKIIEVIPNNFKSEYKAIADLEEQRDEYFKTLNISKRESNDET